MNVSTALKFCNGASHEVFLRRLNDKKF
jgi:hypothetical protein